MTSSGSSTSSAQDAERRILQVLERDLSPIMAKCVLLYALKTLGTKLDRVAPADTPNLLRELERGVRLYAPESAARCVRQLQPVVHRLAAVAPRPDLEPPPPPAPVLPPDPPPSESVTLPIHSEADIVAARHAGREMCSRLGFSRAEEVKTATVISELARNIVLYAVRGEIALRTWAAEGRRGLEIRASDQGPGIPHLDAVLSGRYRSKTGLGLGIVGARKLAHAFHINSVLGRGTEVVARMALR